MSQNVNRDEDSDFFSSDASEHSDNHLRLNTVRDQLSRQRRAMNNEAKSEHSFGNEASILSDRAISEIDSKAQLNAMGINLSTPHESHASQPPTSEIASSCNENMQEAETSKKVRRLQ